MYSQSVVKMLYSFSVIHVHTSVSVDISGSSSQAISSGKVTELSDLVNKMLQVFEPVCTSLKENWANIALQVKTNLHVNNLTSPLDNSSIF